MQRCGLQNPQDAASAGGTGARYLEPDVEQAVGAD
jgi:hypothetical protein